MRVSEKRGRQRKKDREITAASRKLNTGGWPRVFVHTGKADWPGGGSLDIRLQSQGQSIAWGDFVSDNGYTKSPLIIHHRFLPVGCRLCAETADSYNHHYDCHANTHFETT